MTNYNKGNIFVETPCQIRRLYGLPDERERIDLLLSNYDCYTSSMVYIEFKRIILETISLVLDSILEAKPDKNAKVRLATISNMLANEVKIRGERMAKRALIIVGVIQQRFEYYDDDPTVEEVTQYLKSEIRRVALHWFFVFSGEFIRDGQQYIDVISCPLATDDFLPGINITRRLSCRRNSKECNVRTLLRHRWLEVIKIRDAFKTYPKGCKNRNDDLIECVRKVNHLLKKPANDNNSIGEKICWKLGDVIIGLQCPNSVSKICSLDRHFDVICPVLGKERLP